MSARRKEKRWRCSCATRMARSLPGFRVTRRGAGSTCNGCGSMSGCAASIWQVRCWPQPNSKLWHAAAKTPGSTPSIQTPPRSTSVRAISPSARWPISRSAAAAFSCRRNCRWSNWRAFRHASAAARRWCLEN
uniref:Mlr7240-like protein n=1 Tax=Mesorhizobium sp. R88B TaxID=418407 RepID=A2I7S9_9HYPH|nr:Mlr7240-like protein [Mesorhizobium sp. R88B]